MIEQLISEMGNFTQVREDENPVMQLGRFVLGGIGWLVVAAAISTYLMLYLVRATQASYGQSRPVPLVL